MLPRASQHQAAISQLFDWLWASLFVNYHKALSRGGRSIKSTFNCMTMMANHFHSQRVFVMFGLPYTLHLLTADYHWNCFSFLSPSIHMCILFIIILLHCESLCNAHWRHLSDLDSWLFVAVQRTQLIIIIRLESTWTFYLSTRSGNIWLLYKWQWDEGLLAANGEEERR